MDFNIDILYTERMCAYVTVIIISVWIRCMFWEVKFLWIDILTIQDYKFLFCIHDMVWTMISIVDIFNYNKDYRIIIILL